MLKNAAIALLLITAAVGSSTMAVQAQSGAEVEAASPRSAWRTGAPSSPSSSARETVGATGSPPRPLPPCGAAARPMAGQHARHHRRAGSAADRERRRDRSPHHRAAPARRADRVRHPAAPRRRLERPHRPPRPLPPRGTATRPVVGEHPRLNRYADEQRDGQGRPHRALQRHERPGLEEQPQLAERRSPRPVAWSDHG